MASLDLLDPRLRSPKLGSLESSQKKGPVEEDDESEWEYEYSTTETETFYVTLDLSKADFKAQEQVKSNLFPSRGSWQINRASELFLNRRKATQQISHNSGASSAGSSDAERDDEDQADMFGENRDKQPSDAQDNEDGDDEEEDGANHERVQILELHSENPIISYKGRVFSGQWCENTTTELLLTRHDDDSSLPVLKHLDNGVDLLAASCSRINVTEQKFKPKANDSARQRASAHLPQTIIPPADPKATQERNDQRNFLADLIALKRRKGETDDVTVIARSMQGKRSKLRSKGLRTHRRGRWAHADKLQAVRGGQERSRRGGRRKGCGRPRGKWALFPLERAPRDSASIASSGAGSPVDGESGSTPTPFRWDDLDEGRGNSPARMEGPIDVDMEEEQDEDDADSDDNNDFEEEDEDDQDEMDEDED
ncbi:hypothetical protein F5Y09DRAFT_221524 [Xylaria sp. FL1042]|nr:hypothetical protein F5Y09DRAFT_221524 [Xylaria sp. FL1042]